MEHLPRLSIAGTLTDTGNLNCSLVSVTEQGQEGASAEGFSIPVDWSISIDDAGHATVEDAPGRITAASKHDSAGGEHGRLPNFPDKEKRQNGNKGDRLLTHQRAQIACLSTPCLLSKVSSGTLLPDERTRVE